MGGHRLDTAARAVVIATEPAPEADGILGVDAVRVDRVDHGPDDVVLVLTCTAGDAAAWLRARLDDAEAPATLVVLDAGTVADPALFTLGRPVAVTVDDATIGARVGHQARAMAAGARVIITSHPREARRVADVLDAIRSCTP